VYSFAYDLGERQAAYHWGITLADVARKLGHAQVAELLVAHLSPTARLIDALWTGDAARAHAEIDQNANAIGDLHPSNKTLLAPAAWWYRN